MRDSGPAGVQHEVSRGPQVEHDEVRPPGQHGGGFGKRLAQPLCGGQGGVVHGEDGLREERVGEGDVQDGVRHGDRRGDLLGHVPPRQDQEGEPRGERPEVHRVQYLVVRVGEEGDGIGSGRRALGLRSREGCAWVLGRWRKERSARAFGWIFSRMPGDDGSRTRRGPVRFGRGLTRKRESEGGDADADGDFEQELRDVEGGGGVRYVASREPGSPHSRRRTDG